MADPTPYLSSMTATSAALVAIVGGLLVARFVGLDSEQQGAQRLVDEAEERHKLARRRAVEARLVVTRWDARDFLGDPRVLDAVMNGATELDQLRELADCSVEDADLAPILVEVVEEFQAARVYFDVHPLAVAEELISGLGQWHHVRRSLPGLPKIRWEEPWALVFDAAALRSAELAAERRKAEDERKRREEAEKRRGMSAGEISLMRNMDFLSSVRPQNFPIALPSIVQRPMTDVLSTRMRRYDAYVATRERTAQRVEDLEGELARLRRDRTRVVRPDSRLVWGMGVLAFFTVVGIVVPMWVMSRGPHDITAHIRLLFWGFALALGGLIVYMAVYLAKLVTRKSASAEPDVLE